jgi:hypothetical protein
MCHDAKAPIAHLHATQRPPPPPLVQLTCRGAAVQWCSGAAASASSAALARLGMIFAQ